MAENHGLLLLFDCRSRIRPNKLRQFHAGPRMSIILTTAARVSRMGGMSDDKKNNNSRRNRIITIFVVVLIIAAASISRLGKKTDVPVGNIEDNRFLLDTIVSIRLYESDDEALLDDAFNTIEQLEGELSRHKSDSEVSRINNHAGGMVEITVNAHEVLQIAMAYAKLTEGVFDPTVGPLVDLWGIGSENAAVPTEGDLTEVLALVDYREMTFSQDSRKVALTEEGMELDLGGVAKGWIADEVDTLLKAGGAKHILINLGGNVLVSGGKPGGDSFKIGMQDPFDDRGAYLGIFSLTDGSVVSSGVYERYFEFEGKRYHHILNPYTGFPVENGIAAVTVISEKSVDGDALSTALFALGLEKGLILAESLDGIEAAYVTNEGKVVMTAGAERMFEPTRSDLNLEIYDG